MKISFKNIPKFLEGRKIPNWYYYIYPFKSLTNWNSSLNYDKANSVLNTNDHRNAGDLYTVFNKNQAYTNTPAVITQDIQSYYNSLGLNLSAEDFLKQYNESAEKIRNFWNTNRTYKLSNNNEVMNHNRLFRQMFLNRSQLVENGSDYNIGYQDNLDRIMGSSTWLRRMDRYEKGFGELVNTPELLNRLHRINLGNGKYATYFKKENGDIALFDENTLLLIDNNPDVPRNPEVESILESVRLPEETNLSPTQQVLEGNPDEKYGFDWKAFGQKLHGILTNPNLHEAGRLALSLHYNDKIYDEALKGIRPNLKQTYNTYRQVVGDEATKQLYYTKAAEGVTKASRPITSDMDRLVSYLMGSQRIANLLKAEGDLVDNKEIRRTSDESNQHQWANRQRATEVGNYNVASINQANSLRHNLLAQKYSANHSSIDNFWKGLIYNYKQKRAELDALNKQRLALDVADLRDNDLEYLDAYNEFIKVYNENYNSTTGTVNKTDKFNKAYKKWQQALRRMLRKVLDFYNNSIFSAKNGTKITRKKKDDLLYKQTKDTVDHFRKMSKLSSDAQNRKQPKIEKLASHPKTRRYLQGGLAPFVVYTPVALGGETVTQTGGSTTKSNKENETSDLLKDLFKSLAIKGGLPSDSNYVYNLARQLFDKLKYFGEEMTVDDISDTYLRILLQIDNVEFYKKEYENVANNVILKNASGEIAISSDGRVAVQNVDTGKVSYEKWDDVKDSKKYNPLTNRDLLDLRAKVFAFDSNMLNVVSNATSMDEIAKFLDDHFSKLGTNENKIEGYTKLESNMIIQGILILKDAPSGDYKFSSLTKELRQQAQMALSYISKILPRRMKNLLKVNSDLMGVDSTSIITDLIGYNMSNTFNFEIDAVTGKAAKKDSNGSGTGIDATFNDMVQRLLIGIPREFSLITKDGTTKFYSMDSKYVSQLPNVESDMSIREMLYKSELGKILDSKSGITFGDQIINPDNMKDIMYSESGENTFVTLPCKYVNGRKVVNFAIKDSFDEAIEEVSKKIPIDWTNLQFTSALAKELESRGLTSLLKGDSELDPNMLGLFLVVEGYTTDRIKFDKNSKYIEKVSNPDKGLEERLNYALSTKKSNGDIVIDYGVDINDWNMGFLFEGGWDDIYRANVFIPLNNDPLSAQIGNKSLDREDARLLAKEFLNYMKLMKANSTNSSLL